MKTAGFFMKLLAKLARTERFEMIWQRLLLQGLFIFLMGFIFRDCQCLKVRCCRDVGAVFFLGAGLRVNYLGFRLA